MLYKPADDTLNDQMSTVYQNIPWHHNLLLSMYDSVSKRFVVSRPYLFIFLMLSYMGIEPKMHFCCGVFLSPNK